MGYWLLVAMIFCATAIVLIVCAGGPSDAAPEPRTPAPEPETPTNSIAHWTAIVPADAGSSLFSRWPAVVAKSKPDLELKLLPVEPLTATNLRAELRQTDWGAPDIVSLWMGMDDLLSGTPLPSFERELGLTLGDLAYQGTSCVIGTIPNLVGLGLQAADAIDPEDLRLVTLHWNAAINRVAFDFGCDVVDLFDVRPQPPRLPDSGETLESDASMREVARRFDSALTALNTSRAFSPRARNDHYAPAPDV